jgi:hypothetical protein
VSLFVLSEGRRDHFPLCICLILLLHGQPYLTSCLLLFLNSLDATSKRETDDDEDDEEED